jgi:rhodanese-related sulfurtransferase
MDIMKYFRSLSSWSVDEIRKLLREKNPEEYNLVDVRQPEEYEQGHLAGARLIPVGELADRLDEVDPGKPTIVY